MRTPGFALANASMAEGIDSGGTNADEAKVSGKISMNPSACAPSAEFVLSATKAKIHENA